METMIPAVRGLRQRYFTVAMVLLAILMLVLLPAQAASAHSPLESSTPEAGAQLESMPERVELSFGAAVEQTGAEVVVADQDGTDWAAGPAVIADAILTVPVQPGAPEGHYEIRWAVTSFDGAQMKGTVHFAVGDVAPAANLLDRVLTRFVAAWISGTAIAVFSLLAVWMIYGLLTVYHPRVGSRRYV